MRDRYDVLYSPYAWKGVEDPGQNHAVDNEKDPSKTLCGKPVFMWEGTGLGLKEVTCLICRGILDEQSGKLQSAKGKYVRKQGNIQFLGMMGDARVDTPNEICDCGGASRFFYQAKASQAERWFYCTICKQAYPMKERDKHIHDAPEETKYKYLEFHPTQKPLQLIQYLARLITPPNGTMLDPFLGSGTGLIASEREGFNATGIDSNREYCLISYQRLKNRNEQTTLTGEQSKIERIGF